jgi:hypothetical protein
VTTPSELSVRWRERGDELDPYAPAAAAAFRTAASELEEELRAAEEEFLSPAESSAESGLSKRRLRELEAEGKLENHGRKGAPLYKRVDLPRRRAKGDAGGFDAESHVAGIVGARA